MEMNVVAVGFVEKTVVMKKQVTVELPDSIDDVLTIEGLLTLKADEQIDGWDISHVLDTEIVFKKVIL